jgi:hypothetical protein
LDWKKKISKICHRKNSPPPSNLRLFAHCAKSFRSQKVKKKECKNQKIQGLKVEKKLSFNFSDSDFWPKKSKKRVQIFSRFFAKIFIFYISIRNALL